MSLKLCLHFQALADKLLQMLANAPALIGWRLFFFKRLMKDDLLMKLYISTISRVLKALRCFLGSGKTHTMIGGAGEERGVIPRAIERLYARACDLQQQHEWSITLKVLACHTPLCKK